MNEIKNDTMTLRIPSSTLDELEHFADIEHTSKSALIRRAIFHELKRMRKMHKSGRRQWGEI